MHKNGNEFHFETSEARGADTPGVMRYVLVASLCLVIVALSIVWIAGALSLRVPQGDPVTAEEHALGNREALTAFGPNSGDTRYLRPQLGR